LEKPPKGVGFPLKKKTMGAFSSKHQSPNKRPAASSAVRVTEVDRAVLDLKNARDRLRRYRAKLEGDEERLVLRAREARAAGRRDQALGLLRLRKFKQQQLQQTEDQLLNVLQMVETIDSKQNESEVLAAMKSGKDALRRMHEETTVEHVLDLMDQIAEEHAVEQEVTEILAGVPELSAEAEAAVEAELEALQAEMNFEPQLPAAPTEEVLPTAPTTKLPETKVPEKQTASQQPERVAVPG
jgi:hypothetical protein